MTKDGRPSPFNDMRLFFPMKGHDDIVAFGRRLTWWLNGERFSLGHYPALYIVLNPDLPEGEVTPGPLKFTPDDWWFRTVTVGVPDAFLGPDAYPVAVAAITHCLKTLAPEKAALIDRAAQTVTATDCRFLLKVKETAKQIIEVSTTIGIGNEEPPLLFVGLTDKATGTYREAPPAKLEFYDSGVYLTGKIKAARGIVALEPRGSTHAQIIAERQGALSWHDADFTEAPRPVMSGLLKLR